METLPADRHQRLHSRLYRRERQLATAVMKIVMAALDANLVRQVYDAAVAGAVTAVSLNWLAGVGTAGDGSGSDVGVGAEAVTRAGTGTGTASKPIVGSTVAETRQRRVQALKAAPLLIPWLLCDRDSVPLVNPFVGEREEVAGDDDGGVHLDVDVGGEMNDYVGVDREQQRRVAGEAARHARATEISAVVDSGRPLYPVISRLTGLTVRTVRQLRLSQLRIDHLIDRGAQGPDESVLVRLRWLNDIPVERWPQPSASWRLWVWVM